MSEDLNYYVNFRADFQWPNSPMEPSGEELADILSEGLPTHGITVPKTEFVDFAYRVESVSGESTIELMVGAEMCDDQEGRWYVQTCAKQTFFGRKDHPEADCRKLLFAIDKTLRESDRVEDIRWYPGFEMAEYLALMPPSPGPVRDPDFEAKVHPLLRLEWLIEGVCSKILSPLRFACLVLLLFAISPILGFNPKQSLEIAAAVFIVTISVMVASNIVFPILIRREARRRRDPYSDGYPSGGA